VRISQITIDGFRRHVMQRISLMTSTLSPWVFLRQESARSAYQLRVALDTINLVRFFCRGKKGLHASTATPAPEP